VSSLVAPVPCEYLPAAHSTHVLASVAYWPAAHDTGDGVVVGSGVAVVGSDVVVVGSGVVVVVGSGVNVLCAGIVVGARVVVVVGAGVVVVLVVSLGVVDEVVGGGVHINFCQKTGSLLSYVKTVGPKLHSQFHSPSEPSGPVEYGGHGKHCLIELLAI
jgi:hypothetical protein